MLVFTNYMKYNVIHFSTIDSTNSYLKKHYDELDDFTFVSTDYQSLGRGRNDRNWIANKGENLLFSLLIKNQDILKDGPFLSLVAAVSVCKTLEKYNLKNIEIKWPNDVYVNDYKIAGILLESKLPNYLVIGIGLNVNQKQFNGDYRKSPTSMFLQINKLVDINELKKELFQTLFNILNKYDKKDLLSYYEKHDYLLNKEVKYTMNNKILSGTVKGIDDSFNIVISSDENKHHISSGEIELLK